VKPFRERNPVIIGFVGLATIALLIAAAFRADQLPLIGGGDTYYAAFSDAGGLQANDEVRLAGVRVGKVKSIELDGAEVKVELLVDEGTDLGADTGADIRVKTLLGDMFVMLDPAGSGELEPDSTIPLARTTSPYDVVEAFSGLADTADRIDTGQLSKALNTFAAVAEKTPQELRGTLEGLSRLSRNVAARDAQINSLLKNLDDVSGVLADRNTELIKLIKDGDTLFRAVAARRESIHNLLVATQTLSTQLSGLVADTRADLQPALSQLASVVDVLRKNQENLDQSLRLMAPFYRVFANTLGTGPWFDTYVQNIVPVTVPDLPTPTLPPLPTPPLPTPPLPTPTLPTPTLPTPTLPTPTLPTTSLPPLVPPLSGGN
jgi:phospholipid/cholesterol/gamma-HCH transport system substrate-binding protein